MKLSGAFSLGLMVCLAGAGTGQSAIAEDSNSPYIDQLRKSLPPVESSEGYVQGIKDHLAPDTSTGYSQKLKESLENKPHEPSQGYSERVRETLQPKAESGAIEAVKEGRSELKLRKSMDIHSAIGIRVGMGVSRTITAPQIGAGGNFRTIYGNNYAPDVSLYYEYQFLRNERWGSLGAFGMGTIGFFNGSGAFTVPINFAGSGSTVSQSQTNLRFFEVPVVTGLSYRMNLFKYVRPYLMAGPSIIGGSESRNDGISAKYALSYGYWGGGGISILMDWLSRNENWSRYYDYSIKHTYLTLEYSKLSTLQQSPILYDISGFYVGFTFEF